MLVSLVLHVPLKSVTVLWHASGSPDLAGNQRNTVINDSGLMMIGLQGSPHTEVFKDSWALINPTCLHGHM